MEIRRAAVLGAGVMGAAIAGHLANVGIPVYLLDIVPTRLTPEEERRGYSLDSPEVRNRLAAEGRQRLLKTSPAALYTPDRVDLITPGNLEDHLAWLGEVDWVVEAVVENLDVKKELFRKILPFLRPGTIVSTNTSGLSVNQMVEGLPLEFRRNFLGTHFFNPPRYMPLLELIPGRDTSPEVVDFMRDFCDRVLGKGVVLAKDTPNFIANRIGVYGMVATLRAMVEEGLTVEEVDALTGPVMGRPKSASFRTLDLVGLDVFLHVARNVAASVTDPAEKEAFRLPDFVLEMVRRGWLGEKAGQGFYKKVSQPQKEILALDYNTLEYRSQVKVNLPGLTAARALQDPADRFKALLTAKDRGGRFTWRIVRDTLAYAAAKAAEIADDIVAVDRAMKWGFNWSQGPFELWDTLGVPYVASRMEAEGVEVPALVKDLLAAGHKSFYRKENGRRYFYGFDGSYRPEELPAGVIVLTSVKEQGRVLARNAGASLLDLGDGVLCVEFHSRGNSIGQDTIQMLRRGLAELEKGYVGMVIGNQGHNFSAGANLFLLLMAAQEQEWDEVDLMVRQFQQVTMALKYSSRPVVAAPFRMTVAGGCEICLAAPRVQAAAETYMGLVEVGVGLLPAGGGIKEMLLRSQAGLPAPLESRIPQQVDLQPLVNRAFEIIATAKVATSAAEARHFGFLRPGDGITVNTDRLIGDAKAAVLEMAAGGYRPPQRARIKVTGTAGYANLELVIYTMHQGGYISDHDARIARKIAHVITGGGVVPGSVVSEEYILDLEREGFLSLLGEPKTQERIKHMLQTGKPLRN